MDIVLRKGCTGEIPADGGLDELESYGVAGVEGVAGHFV